MSSLAPLARSCSRGWVPMSSRWSVPGVGDATRKQLVDVEGADSLYFTMLNHNKRSLTLNTKEESGKEVLGAPGQDLRRAGGKFRAGRARSHGASAGNVSRNSIRA